ncbi:peptide deformylase [bacterium]|nr:peptide deformylase [bacterium]
MAALEVLIYGHPFLRKTVGEVRVPDERVSDLALNMIETMTSHNGVGLAAPQVHADARLIVIDPGRLAGDRMPRPMTLVNPFILSADGQNVFNEGCLSMPDIYADVTRPENITIQFQDLKGQMLRARYSGVEARIIQHEIDHLNGILFIDYLNPVRRWLLKSKLTRLKKQSGTVGVRPDERVLTVKMAGRKILIMLVTATAVIGLITLLSYGRKDAEESAVIEMGNAHDIFLKNCATCHGTEGGGTTQAKGLRGRSLDREYVKKIIQTGNTVMPRFHFIHEPVLSELADYVHNLK